MPTLGQRLKAFIDPPQPVQPVPARLPFTSPVPVSRVVPTTPVAEQASFGGLPQMTSMLTFKEIGASGLRAFAGWVREEFLPQLVGRQGARTYREMQDTSPIIGGILFAIISCMRKVTWRTMPANDSAAAQEAVDFIDSCREDMSHTWEDFIVEALSMLTYGYAPHEIVYKQRLGRDPGVEPDGTPRGSSKFDDGLIGWRRIPLRGQDTILKWFLGPNDDIQGVTQQPYVGPIRNIPIEKMLLFRPSQHKNNPEGRSILRNSYRSYYFVKRIEEQEAIIFERMNGLPVLSVPAYLIEQAAAGDSNAVLTLEAYKKIALNLRIDDQMGVVLPSDRWPGVTGAPSAERLYDLQLLTPTSGGAGRGATNASETINRHNTNMMISVMADFLMLGHEKIGTQSLSTNKTDMFFQAIEGFLNSGAGVINRYGIPRLWALNGFNPDLMPAVVPDLAVRTDLDVLSNFVLRMSQAGMPLFPNPEVERALYEAAGLPDVDEDKIEELHEIQDAQQQAEMDARNAAMAETPIGKILLRSLARRMHKHAGPRFGITTKGK